MNNKWAILVMILSSATVLVVMIMQRPRPSYMFGLSIPLMALTGFSIYALFNRLRNWTKWQFIAPTVMALLIAITPIYYNTWRDEGGLRLASTFRKLSSYSQVIDADKPGLVVPAYLGQIPAYLSTSGHPQATIALPQLSEGSGSPADINSMLIEAGARVVYLDNHHRHDPEWKKFHNLSPQLGWSILATSNHPNDSWTLLHRSN